MSSKNLNIYKFSDRINSFEDIVLRPAQPPFEQEAEKTDGEFQYKLFVQRDRKVPPQWASLMTPLLKRNVLNSTASFLLLARVVSSNGRIKYFALTGGYSAHGLIHRYIEEGFGLKIAEKVIDPKRIKNLTQTSFTGSERQIIRAVSMYDPMYDPENQRRILKSLEGKPLNRDLIGLSVAGADSLKVRIDTEFDNLKEYLSELARIDDDDREVSLWPRNYIAIKDEDTIQILTGMLAENFSKLLGRNGLEEYGDNFYVGYKNFFDFLKCDSFQIKYGSQEQPLEDLDIESIVGFLKRNDFIFRPHMLSGIKITGLDEGHEIIPETELAHFIYSEIEYSERTYFYIDGQWFLLHDAYKQSIDQRLSQVQVKDYLPSYNPRLFPTEGAYNEWVPSQDGQFVCLDKKLVEKIEICDLFRKNDSHFVHVKKGWGAKLSHLFAQGAVSATLFATRQDFRAKCCGKCSEIPPDKKDGACTVVFAIIHKNCSSSNFPNNMTYFSKVNFLGHEATLMQLGFNVVLVPVTIS